MSAKIARGNLFNGFTKEMVPVTVKFTKAGGFVEIAVQGYGERAAEDGNGSPVLLEFHEGRLRLVIFDDINGEDPLIINLEGARESKRKQLS